MNDRHRYDRVLAIYFNTRGFAFTVFEGRLAAVDWDVKEMRGPIKRSQGLRRIKLILDRYQPDVLVLQNTSARGTARVRRIRSLNSGAARLGRGRNIPVFTYSRAAVRAVFAPLGGDTKEAIAGIVAKHFPEFARFVPPKRKPWMSEDARMGLFDAAALAISFYQTDFERPQLRTQAA